MKRLGLFFLLLCFMTNIWSQDNVIVTQDLEYYGAQFRASLQTKRAPKVPGGLFDFYQIENYFSRMKPKEAIKISQNYKKTRKAQYSQMATILYHPISQIFDIPYDPQKIINPDQFFTSAIGLHLLLQVMNQYLTDDGKFERSLLDAILDIFKNNAYLEITDYLRPIMAETIAADLLAHPFKKEDHRQQILNRAMGILMFSYYHPAELEPEESWLMWQEVEANEQHLIHKFANMDYEFYHHIMHRGVITLANLTDGRSEEGDRDRFNRYLLQEIFKDDQQAFNRTFEASRNFLHKDQLEQVIFYPY